MRYLHFILAVIVVLLPLMFSNINALPPKECLKMICPNDPNSKYDSTSASWNAGSSSNPDSVLVDSCDNSATYLKIFAKRYFTIKFVSHYYPFNKVIDTSDVMETSDISNSKLLLKQQLQQLESNFGKIYIRGMGNENIETEEAIIGSCLFRIFFESYQDVAAIEDYVFNNIDSVTFFTYENRAGFLSKVEDLILIANSIQIEPNPTSSSIKIQIQKNSIFNNNIEIYNAFGLIIRDLSYSEEINVSDLPSGVYFLKYGNHTGKFIKE